MIDPRELRIGNNILHNGDLCTVFSISQEWLRVTKDRNIAISYDNISGIHLDEQWLLSMGAEEADYFKRRYYLGRVSFTVNVKGLVYKIDCGGIKFGSYFIHEKIKYVHQFENLYFDLSGEELMIKTGS